MRGKCGHGEPVRVRAAPVRMTADNWLRGERIWLPKIICEEILEILIHWSFTR
jgi:hypothetical protein